MTRKRMICLAAGCLVALPLFTQSVFARSQVGEISLSNGITLLTSEDHSVPMVSVGIAYHVGKKNERPGITGISHICHRIMSYGTPAFRKGEYTRIIQGGGGSSHSYSGFDMSMFGVTVPSAMLDTVLILGADQMQNVEVTFEKLVSAKEAIRKERLAYVEGWIYGPLNEEIFNLAYRAHPYQYPYYGWPNEIQGLTINDVKDFLRTYYQPANATIVLVGDFETDAVVKLITELYGPILPRKMPPDKPIVEPEQRGERRSVIGGFADIPLIVLCYHIPETGHPDRPALQVLSRIEGIGESSRLHQRMISKEKSALAAQSHLVNVEGPGLIVFYAIMNYDSPVEDGEQQLLDEIERIKLEYVSDTELEKAKNQIEAEYYRSIRSLGHRCEMIAQHQLLHGDWRVQHERVAAARAVTKEDVMRVARKYLTRINRTVTILQPDYYFDETDEAGYKSDED
ncbi:MAG: insulinase family protein [Candidatus Zixiibacteriota bacterium]|nr:MAG: insulinase family protein [candidate division Zixibacteria bacterium]